MPGEPGLSGFFTDDSMAGLGAAENYCVSVSKITESARPVEENFGPRKSGVPKSFEDAPAEIAETERPAFWIDRIGVIFRLHQMLDFAGLRQPRPDLVMRACLLERCGNDRGASIAQTPAKLPERTVGKRDMLKNLKGNNQIEALVRKAKVLNILVPVTVYRCASGIGVRKILAAIDVLIVFGEPGVTIHIPP